MQLGAYSTTFYNVLNDTFQALIAFIVPISFNNGVQRDCLLPMFRRTRRVSLGNELREGLGLGLGLGLTMVFSVIAYCLLSDGLVVFL